MSAAKPSLADWMKSKPGATLPAAPKMTASTGNGSSNESGDWGITISPSDVKTLWSEGFHLVEIVEAGPYTSSSGNKTLKVSYKCIGGSNQGKYRDDYMPLAGNGRVKTYTFAEAIGLRDKDTGDVSLSNREQLVGRKLWVEIVHKIDEWNGEERTKDEIRFPNGYKPLDAFQAQKDGDLFAEEGQPLPAEAKAPALTPAAEDEIVGIEPGTDDAPAFA